MKTKYQSLPCVPFLVTLGNESLIQTSKELRIHAHIIIQGKKKEREEKELSKRQGRKDQRLPNN
jgi:hypothetical protein